MHPELFRRLLSIRPNLLRLPVELLHLLFSHHLPDLPRWLHAQRDQFLCQLMSERPVLQHVTIDLLPLLLQLQIVQDRPHKVHLLLPKAGCLVRKPHMRPLR